ncbi:ras-related C3 botulinum toxin substrate 1-like protein [Leptotrombidium deliense]|uniref:Ras-related C3 botulinum toxin substrate 1-like protein n=1 Tax=Leptotrombidium deliense TaxID=299467 RepID=A0A443SWP1_9ACAR|nr:ras-related C3 botulinum toxin substrate 1-like protein [Leptotrombidium deliense]
MASNGRSFTSSSAHSNSVSNRGNKRSFKVVVVGDGSVGKTCLLIAYTTKQFPYGDYVPTADVFLLCFSVDSIHSYQNIISKWAPEIKHHCPKVPYVLVGTKTDLRPNSLSKKSSFRRSIERRCASVDDSSCRFVTRDMGKKLAAKIKATRYVESSAKTMDGVEEVSNVFAYFHIHSL